MPSPLVRAPAGYVPGQALSFGSRDGAATFVDPQNPLPTTATFAASGRAPVTGSFAGAGTSAAFQPVAGRDFNVTVAGGAGTVQVERSFDAGTSWFVCVTDQMRQSLPESFALSESETGVAYRVRCTAVTQAPIAYRVSQ